MAWFGTAWYGTAWYGPAWFGGDATTLPQGEVGGHGGGRKDERLRELIQEIVRKVNRWLTQEEREALLREFAQRLTHWDSFYTLLFQHELNERLKLLEEEEVVVLTVMLDE